MPFAQDLDPLLSGGEVVQHARVQDDVAACRGKVRRGDVAGEKADVGGKGARLRHRGGRDVHPGEREAEPAEAPRERSGTAPEIDAAFAGPGAHRADERLAQPLVRLFAEHVVVPMLGDETVEEFDLPFGLHLALHRHAWPPRTIRGRGSGTM
jgi:hypothetical protein